MKFKNYQQKSKRTVPHYGLRKLTVGVASVLLSTSFYLGTSVANGHAAPVSGSASTTTLTASPTSAGTSAAARQVTLHQSRATSSAANDRSTSTSTLAASKSNSSASPSNSSASNATTSSSAAQPTNPTPASSAQSGNNAASSAAQLPTATRSLDHLVGSAANQIHATAAVSQSQGDTTTGTAGETNLHITLDIPAAVIRQIQSGDYLDVKVGLPYEVNGQQYIMAYGAINPQNGVIRYLYWNSQSHNQVVGYITAAGNVSGYQQTVAVNGGTPQVITNDNTHADSLGTSNGYFQIIFTDGFQQYLSTHVGNSGDWRVDLNLNYYNGLQDETRKAEAPTLTLYGDSNGTYTPTNDVQIGDYATASGLTFNVVKAQNDVVISTETVAIDHSGNVPAHRWALINGHYVLGVPDKNNPSATPQQGVGVSLTSQKDAVGNPVLSNHFDIQVTKPADAAGVLSMTFVSAQSLQDQLQNLIVPKSNSSQLEDQVTGTSNYISNQYLYHQPTVHVTSDTSNDGNTITYHVSIDGEYGGFRANSTSNDQQHAIVTLINWMPDDTNGLLPPASIQTPEEDRQAVTYVVPAQNHWFAGYPVRNLQISSYLMTRPWSIRVSNAQQTFLNTQQGYWIDRSTNGQPTNTGDASTQFYGYVNEVIHYVDQHGNPMMNNGQAIRDHTATLTFESDPTHDNAFTDSQAFVNVAVPSVSGYTAHAGIMNGNQLAKNGNLARYDNPVISAYGQYGPVTYPHDDVVLYVVYVPTSQPTQPSQTTKPTEPTQPSQHSQPSQPTGNTQPTQPTVPTQPTGNTQPTAPTVPTQPTNNPTNPTVPTQPTSATKPTQPKGHTSEPTQPTSPSIPTSPTNPSAPVNPTSPTIPSTPAKPTSPTAPTIPETPNQPTAPVQPTTSTKPGQPVEPGAVVTPLTKPRQESKLPQTGNQRNRLGLLGLGLVGMMTLLGFSQRRHEK